MKIFGLINVLSLSLGLVYGLGALLVFGLLGFGAFSLKQRLRRISRTAFGVDSFLEGVRKQELEYSETPKSLSGMESIYLPLIARDFPGFNLQQFIKEAEDSLLSVFNAIEAQDIELLKNTSSGFRNKARELIVDLKSRGEIQYYDDVKIHRTVLSRYDRTLGKRVIRLQTALEARNYILKDGELIKGFRDRKTQSRYEIDLIYIQDIERAGLKDTSKALGINCPNCSAPVTELGRKICKYCGSGIELIDIRAWSLSDYREI